MKFFTCLVFFAILQAFNSNGQTSVYHPFPDSNVVWNIETFGMCSIALQDRQWFSLVISGDTLIGPYNYHKVYSPLTIDSSECFGNSVFSRGYIGAVRQDTAARTVYYFEKTAASEQLLYDFNMQVGDTLRGYLKSFGCQEDSVIIAEDSVLIGNNYRKRWTVPIQIGPAYIIEGIGYAGGPFSQICSWFEYGEVLTCFMQDNSILYNDSIYYSGNCDVINTIPSNTIPSKYFTIFPNPISATAVVESSFIPYMLTIFDAYGKRIRFSEINSSTSEISSIGLLPGLYFFLASGLNGSIASGKFIVE